MRQTWLEWLLSRWTFSFNWNISGWMTYFDITSVGCRFSAGIQWTEIDHWEKNNFHFHPVCSTSVVEQFYISKVKCEISPMNIFFQCPNDVLIIEDWMESPTEVSPTECSWESSRSAGILSVRLILPYCSHRQTSIVQSNSLLGLLWLTFEFTWHSYFLSQNFRTFKNFSMINKRCDWW